MSRRILLRLAISAGVVAVVLLGTMSTAGVRPASAPRPLTTQTPVAHVGAPAGHPVATAISTRLMFRLPPIDGEEYTPNARNIALRTTVDGPLLLFLPATRAVPHDYRAFLDTASSLGYHVLALDYWNLGQSVAVTCGADPRCYGKVQANRFDGSHASRYSAIERSDSILARLTQALRMLTLRDPGGGWNSYLRDGRIRWHRLVLAGHSQGGGESAYIAHRHRVQGVLMFASPVATDGAVVARWLSTAGATPLDRYYGFDARDDMYAQRIQGSWAALKVGEGQPIARIAARPPIDGSHRIVTDLDLGSPQDAHKLMITDAGPRTSTGTPLFQSVWRWMLKAVRS